MSATEVDYLDLGDLLIIASAVLRIDAEVLANAANLVVADSALHAPQAAFDGHEFYPDFEVKVGVLGYRHARNHSLPDGNKRTALLSMIEFAERNGWTWRDLDEDETVDAMIQAASGDMVEDDFIAWVTAQLTRN